MDFRYRNRTDFLMAGACVFSLLIFLINAKLDSIIPVYINGVLVLGAFTYWSLKHDPANILRRSLIIGAIGGFFYTFIDNLFVQLGVVTYLRSEDLVIFSTPVGVIMVWIYSITTAIYIYQRLRSAFSRFYIPSLLTGISVFAAGVVLNHLGDYARIWVWNAGIPPSPSIGATPLFLPVGLAVTFFLSPYIVGGQRITERMRITDNPIAAGVRCSIMLALGISVSFWSFTRYYH